MVCIVCGSTFGHLSGCPPLENYIKDGLKSGHSTNMEANKD
jgi:hypothetical protein